ncbi:integrase domain-containing protein [Photobacterium phosphoreum]|uniref:integrase domain-containing protein n=1 Tax=Photobacterium phosphoreum TaxID=659 RepID=UPI001E31323F|nr:integrase domain-containing protein [Photobacterium phosphoreum]MCD9477321.1 tyrosine-type recombinase/integrase [Photobacterium phosphoreum]MCF2178146.1 tyrosine-type recombinase/integrase [Photobacterium phosphoreum]
MARLTKPLTDTQIKQAKPKEKIYNLADGEGLALRIKPNGTKSWLFDYYRPFTKKRTSLTFGTYPSLSLADARKQKLAAKALLAENIDPKDKREEEHQQQRTKLTNTLQAVAEAWFIVKKASVTPDYAEDIWRSLELHIFPAIGNMPISQIKATHAIDTLRPIAAKGSLETVKRLSQRLNEIMIFAINTGLIDANTLAGIKAAFSKPVTKNMPSLNPNELPELMVTLSQASITKTTRCLIEFELHTIVRPSEAAKAKWEEIDFINAKWTIPAHRMKMSKDHVIPLSPQVINILKQMKLISGNRDYIFPSIKNPTTHINAQTANAALIRMGFKGRLVSHGLRSIASTALNELDNKFDGDVIEAALSHTEKNSVRSAYNHATYYERRIELMCWWSNYIEDAATGSFSLGATNN